MDIDLNKIEETPHLLSLLLEVEDVLDSLDVYVFKNWLGGEVVQGPLIRRYWVSVTLMFPEDKMPDPRAGLRLLKHGVMVKFTKKQPSDAPGSMTEPVWLVEVDVPRKLLNGMNDSNTDFYDDEIDVDDVADARDLGVDDESAYDGTGVNDDQNQ